MKRPEWYVPWNKAADMTGQVVGRWTVIGPAPNRGEQRYWLCRCECGTEREVCQNGLRASKTTSCGKGLCAVAYKHGHGQKVDTRASSEYWAWANMKKRCGNPKYHLYHHYGGRGITVCSQWHDSFEQFLADMGPKPSPDMSLDRINNNGNYEPGNCRWATAKEQCANKQAPNGYPAPQREKVA